MLIERRSRVLVNSIFQPPGAVFLRKKVNEPTREELVKWAGVCVTCVMTYVMCASVLVSQSIFRQGIECMLVLKEGLLKNASGPPSQANPKNQGGRTRANDQETQHAG